MRAVVTPLTTWMPECAIWRSAFLKSHSFRKSVSNAADLARAAAERVSHHSGRCSPSLLKCVPHTFDARVHTNMLKVKGML